MSTDNSDHRWTACPPGSVSGIVRRSRSRRRNTLLREAAAMVVLAASIGFTAGYFARPDAKPPASMGPFGFAGISCDEVRPLLSALMANRLDPAKAAQLRRHIMECPECGRLMRQMPSAQSISQLTNRVPPEALASARTVRRAGEREL